MTTLPHTPISLPQHIDSTMLLALYQHLSKALTYDSNTGKFFWRTTRRNGVRKGVEAGTINLSTGYKSIQIKWKGKLCQVQVHKLVWFVETGIIPEKLDHRDRVKTNNTFTNLREATHQQNMQNRSRASNNTSGTTGVSWNCAHKRWIAYVYVSGKRIDLGRFKNKLNAVACRLEGERKYFGEFGAQI